MKAEDIRDTPEFRAAFSRAVRRFLCLKIMAPGGPFDEAFQEGFADFKRGRKVTFAIRYDVDLIENDTIFMPLLFEEARREQ